jgi:hypothetical protein
LGLKVARLPYGQFSVIHFRSVPCSDSPTEFPCYSGCFANAHFIQIFIIHRPLPSQVFVAGLCCVCEHTFAPYIVACSLSFFIQIGPACQQHPGTLILDIPVLFTDLRSSVGARHSQGFWCESVSRGGLRRTGRGDMLNIERIRAIFRFEYNVSIYFE